MTTEPNEFIHTTFNQHGDPMASGLTKREYFAAMALSSLSKGIWAHDQIDKGEYDFKSAAATAVALSDALIEALNK